MILEKALGDIKSLSLKNNKKHIPDDSHNLSHLLSGLISKTQFWLVIFIFLIIMANMVLANQNEANNHYISSIQKDYGGPEINFGEDIDSMSSLAVSANHQNPVANIIFIDDAFVGISRPFSTIIPDNKGIFTYKVQDGDNLSTIANRFGVSINTIRWANSGVNSVINPGQELTILPVPGIVIETNEGDTLESLADNYDISPEFIKQYNPDHQNLFSAANQSVILPYAEPKSNNTTASSSDNTRLAPVEDDFFQFPTDVHNAWNWGILHAYNAVDIASSCGNPMYASAAGIVEEVREGWNGGYGNYILISHSNGTKTKYAHNLRHDVIEGQYVLKGQKIGLIGNTGNVHGPTGCHIHFEVHGAQNPFAIR